MQAKAAMATDHELREQVRGRYGAAAAVGEMMANDEGGLVAVRYVITGTHKGVFNGAPPSGSDVSFDAHDWFMVQNGKITEQWVVLDALGLLQQIGVIPTS
jgi:predicted ester cyclase